MILSHKYKFIFVKTAKTAGTSIEIALSKFCGPDDIITPLGPNAEEIRSQLGYRGPQNYLPAMSEYSWQDWLRFLYSGRPKRCFNHMTAREVRAFIGRKTFNSYFKFCFERNPWDRMISVYYYIYRHTASPPSLDWFIHEGTEGYHILKGRGYDSYTLRGRVAVDRVCLYENLAEELEWLRVHLGLPEKLELPRAKGSIRVDRRHYREVLRPHERERLAREFSREIEMFNYKF